MHLNTIGWVVAGWNDLAHDRKNLKNNETLKKELACRNYLVSVLVSCYSVS